MTCPTASVCVAVGTTIPAAGENEGVVVTITGGTPGSAQPVPNTAVLHSVACPTATNCEAVGENYPPFPSGQGVAVTITSGTPGSAQAVPGTAQPPRRGLPHH